MADTKQILVVDDHFEMLEFLRSMLELSSPDFRVLGVPSAEEGFLELRRIPFDLLITDLRLPGMSGFDLVRKVKATCPEMPVIMITGYSSEQGKKEAAELGVFRYFQKPLDTEALLATVQAALYGRQELPSGAEDSAGGEDLTLDPEVARRLDILRSDTGARMIVLSNSHGAILYQMGEAGGLNVPQLAQTIADTIKGSFLLADQLGSDEPFAIQYQAGQRFDLYSANVGRGHFMAIFFDAASRRGRIGTIWVFAQRAIKDLLPLLRASAAGRPSVVPPEATQPPVSQLVSAPAKTAPTPKKKRAQPNIPAAPAPEPAQLPPAEAAPQLEADPVAEPDVPPVNLTDLPPLPEFENVLERKDTGLDLDAFWDTAVDEVAAPPAADGLVSLAEIQAQGLVDLEFEAPPESGSGGLDLDAFWDEALTGEPAGGLGSGFSLEEAKRQGLLPPEIDLEA
jgi:DNA-binding NarL/FixJ family response regulator